MSQLDWLCIQSHILASTKNKVGHESHYAFSTLHNTLWMRKWVRVWLVLWALRFHGYDRALVLSQSIALGFSRNHVESSVPCENNTRWQRSLCSGQLATIIRPALQRRTLLIISIKPFLSKFSSSRREIVSSYEALLANVRFSRHWSFVLWLQHPSCWLLRTIRSQGVNIQWHRRKVWNTDEVIYLRFGRQCSVALLKFMPWKVGETVMLKYPSRATILINSSTEEVHVSIIARDDAD